VRTVLAKRPPSVGELRGKTWIVGGIGVDFGEETYRLEGVMGITDSPAIYLQNFWHVFPESIEDKSQHALHTALEIPCEEGRVKANFLSGSVGVEPL
jgi:hypothetical protein